MSINMKKIFFEMKWCYENIKSEKMFELWSMVLRETIYFKENLLFQNCHFLPLHFRCFFQCHYLIDCFHLLPAKNVSTYFHFLPKILFYKWSIKYGLSQQFFQWIQYYCFMWASVVKLWAIKARCLEDLFFKTITLFVNLYHYFNLQVCLTQKYSLVYISF